MGLMGIIAIAVLILICIIGLLVIPIGMPGTFVIFAGAVIYNLINWSMELSFTILGVLLGAAILGEILEYSVGIRAAKKHGASKPAIIGAVVGGIIGAIIGAPVPIIGSLIGLFIGVFAGAFLLELLTKGSPSKAMNSAIGAFKGRIGAILAKFAIGIGMVVIILMAVF